MAKKSVAGTVDDPTIEFVSIEIDGRQWNLCYDFNAIAIAEKLAECNLLQGIAGVVLHSMTASQLRGLFYAALLKAHPKITIDEAGSLININSMPDIREALMKSYGVSMPEKKPDPSEAEQPAQS